MARLGCLIAVIVALAPLSAVGQVYKWVDKDGIITAVDVRRGAPCGATWEAARRMQGLRVEDAPVRMGLDTQFFCTADPSNWDPIWGKSPVHLAADLHRAALAAAIKKVSPAGRGPEKRNDASIDS